jgi:Na+/melibiose symporter-like transporter
VVLGVLQSSTWGWVEPKDAPFTVFGFSPTVFVIAGGGLLLWAFAVWQRHRERVDTDPLVHLDLLRIPMLRSGLSGLFTQNLILMGVFFVVPLYLQLVLGLNALDTGIRMLPISIAMFVTSAIGSRLSTRFSVRGIVRSGLVTAAAAVLILLATIDPVLKGGWFALSMAILGIGMGLIVSQLGNVVQSSVDASGRSEAGGLQYTGQQLGSSLGIALIGAIVLTGLTSTFVSQIEEDQQISAEISAEVGVRVQSGLDFVDSDQVRAAVDSSGLDQPTADALVENYEQAQLQALKSGLLAAALLALLSLAFTKELPSVVAGGSQALQTE